MAYVKWSDTERAELRKLAKSMPAVDIARKIGRSVNSVNMQAQRLGLSLHCPEPSKPPSEPKVEKHIKSRKFDPADPMLRSATVAELRKSALSRDELADYLGTTQANAGIMLDSLRQAGYHVQSANGRFKIGILLANTVPTRVTSKRFAGKPIAFGILSDTHLCSTRQRLDMIEQAFSEFKRQGVKDVYVPGNMLDGYLERINGGEVYLRNVTDQCVYMADHWPQMSGITTHFITGDCHEGWYAKNVGLNVGHHMEDEARRHGRDDIKYLGHMEADIELVRGSGRSVMRLFHPGGGSSYAQSYKAQKIVESYQGGEKPHILILGHFHKLGFFYPRGVVCLLAGCAQDQTQFMRKKHIEAHVGFSILRVQLDATGGIASATPTIYPFYDRQYHLNLGEWETALSGAISA